MKELVPVLELAWEDRLFCYSVCLWIQSSTFIKQWGTQKRLPVKTLNTLLDVCGFPIPHSSLTIPLLPGWQAIQRLIPCASMGIQEICGAPPWASYNSLLWAISWRQLKVMKFWPREMPPALAGGSQPGQVCGPRQKEEKGVRRSTDDCWLCHCPGRDMTIAGFPQTASCSVVLVSSNTIEQEALLSTCAWCYSGISIHSLAGEQSLWVCLYPVFSLITWGLGRCI